MTKHSLFRYFQTSPEIIRLAVMLYVRFPLSLRNVEDLLHERGIDVSYETIRFWWNRFGPMLASEIATKRRDQARVTKNANQSRRLLALAEIYDGVTVQTYYRWRKQFGGIDNTSEL